MRINLVNLPWNKNGRLGVRAGSRWPFTSEPEKDNRIHYIPFPFFLAYATAVLKKEAKDANLIDAIAQEMEGDALVRKIKSCAPELLVAEVSTPSFSSDIKMIREIRQKLPDCRMALCGPHATTFPEEILDEHDFVDYILMGEYEYTLLDLVNRLEEKKDLKSVCGLAFRDAGKIRVNGPRGAIANLDGLPWPERETLPIYKYNDGFCGLPVPNVQMWTSRGCPFECIFCLWPQTIYGRRTCRARDPVDVVDEMEYLVKKFNFKAVYFDDDVFNADRKHVAGVCQEIAKRQIRVPWAAMARADLMDSEILKLMADAGLYAIKYGIESANQGILDGVGKNMNIQKAKEIIRQTKALGIKVHLTFCLGLPGENQETIQETIKFIQEARPYSLQFSFATPFPGTEYFKYVRRAGDLLSQDWSDYDANQRCIIKTQELTDKDLEAMRAALSNNFNFQ